MKKLCDGDLTVWLMMPKSVRDQLEADEAAGPHPCTGGCGTMMRYSTDTCRACARKQSEEQSRLGRIRWLQQSAQDAVPASFAWAELSSELLPKRIGGASTLKKVQAAHSALRDGTATSATFVGQAGSGKTSAACAILRDWILSGKSGRFVDSFELSRAYRNASLGSEPPLITACCETKLLVVDDIGIEPPSGREAIIEVVHRRHSAGSPTIFTTGFNQAALQGFYGAGIARRLFERSVTIQFGPKGQ